MRGAGSPLPQHPTTGRRAERCLRCDRSMEAQLAAEIAETLKMEFLFWFRNYLFYQRSFSFLKKKYFIASSVAKEFYFKILHLSKREFLINRMCGCF